MFYSYRRNKSEIEKELFLEGEMCELYEIVPGFYNKALIYKSKNANLAGKFNYYLMSYDTVVAKVLGEKTLIVNDWYSSTTSRHINDFIGRFGIHAKSKKELEKGLALVGDFYIA